MTEIADGHEAYPNGANIREALSGANIERLGYVSCPSGILLVLDGGCAWMWSHDREPSLSDHPEPGVVRAAASARDLAVTGPDAAAAGQAFNRSKHPLFLYDRPLEHFETLRKQFDDLVAKLNLSASLTVLPERVPHRRRVDLLLDGGGQAGIVEFHGLSAAVVSGVPRERALPILGERMPDGPDAGPWRRVWIDMRDGEVASRRAFGEVWVDEARLMATDVETLGSWDDRHSQDGKADVVFWGRDAATIAAQTGAGLVEVSARKNIFGWLDRALDDALAQALHLDGLRSAELRFAVDYRPHTHQWQIMSKVRNSPSESAGLELAGAQLAMVMTTWGDGVFPVEADYDASGNILRLRIELGCDEIVARQRSLVEQWSHRRQ